MKKIWHTRTWIRILSYLFLLILGIIYWILYAHGAPLSGIAVIIIPFGVLFIFLIMHIIEIFIVEDTFSLPDRRTLDVFLKDAIERAQSNIKVANFTKYSPTRTVEGSEYCNAIRNLVKENSKIEFQRLVTIPTEEKWEWIQNTLQEMKPYDNFKMKYVTETVGMDNLAIYMPTFYIIDQKIVCIGFSDPDGSGLNLCAEDKILACELRNYFDRLWGLSTCETLNVNDDKNYKTIKSQINSKLKKQLNNKDLTNDNLAH